ncbi:unnamed protein product [Trichobilharzia szidati]|nr:unnamed protein product [Trichobilharzia szidati]
MPNNCPFPVYFRDRYPADLFRVHQRLTRPNCSQHVFTDYYYIIINCIIPYTSILSFLTGIPLIVLLKLKVKATNYYLHYWGIFILFSHITYFIITACQWLYYLINSKSLTISSDWMCKLMSSAFRFITYIQFNSTILIISRELLVYNRRLRRWSREFILMYSTPSRSIFWLMLSLSILLSVLQTLPTYFISQLNCDNDKHPTTNNNNKSTATTGSDVVPHCQCIIQPIWSSISDDYRFWYKLHRIVFCEGVLPIVCLIFLSQKLLLKLKIHCLIVQAMRHDVSSGQGLHNTLQETSFQSYQSDYSPPGERNLPKKMEYYYAKLMNRSREGLESLKSRSKLAGLLRRKSSKQLE